MVNLLSYLFIQMDALIFPASCVQNSTVKFVNIVLKKSWSGQWKIFQVIQSTAFCQKKDYLIKCFKNEQENFLSGYHWSVLKLIRF